MTLQQHRAGAAVAILLALIVPGITRGPHSAAAGQARTGIPRVPEPMAVVSAPQFKTAVTLVKLDSCDPAVLAKATQARVGMAETAEQNRTRAAMEQYSGLLTAYAEGDAARSVDSLLELSRPLRDRALMAINKRGADLHGLWDAGRYALAVMLHTDAGLQVASDTYGADTYDQFQVAADVLQLGVGCAPEQMRSFAQRWYVALSRLLRDRGGRTPSAQQKRCSSLGGTVWTPSRDSLRQRTAGGVVRNDFRPVVDGFHAFVE